MSTFNPNIPPYICRRDLKPDNVYLPKKALATMSYLKKLYGVAETEEDSKKRGKMYIPYI